MHGAAPATTLKTTTTRKTGPKALQEVRIEPADNGYTVHARHHNDYMEPGPPPKGTVFEKANGHGMLKHVAKHLGIKAKITEPAEGEDCE